MPLLTIVPPMPGAERRFKLFVDFVHTAGWETEFVRLEIPGRQPPFGSTEIFPQVDTQTAGKVVMGFSLGALYSHLGALRARHLILGSIAPFFLEDDDEPERWMISYRAGNAHTPADILVGGKEDGQMHRRAMSLRDFYESTLHACLNAYDRPCLLVRVALGLSKSEQDQVNDSQTSFLPDDQPIPQLRACVVQPNPSARAGRLSLHWNMRVPVGSHLYRAFQERQLDLDYSKMVRRENLSVWEHSDGRMLSPREVTVHTRVLGDGVQALLVA